MYIDLTDKSVNIENMMLVPDAQFRIPDTNLYFRIDPDNQYLYIHDIDDPEEDIAMMCLDVHEVKELLDLHGVDAEIIWERFSGMDLDIVDLDHIKICSLDELEATFR
jgi:hypothetical protein